MWPLYEFLVGKCKDVVAAKTASSCVQLVLENAFQRKKYTLQKEDQAKMLGLLLGLLEDPKFFLPAYEQAVRQNMYRCLLVFTAP